MTASMITRRRLVAGAAAVAGASMAAPALAQGAAGRVVVVGGGFGGAAFARTLRRVAPGVAVLLAFTRIVMVTDWPTGRLPVE